MRLKADLTLFFVSLLWGSAFVFQRIVGEQGGVYYFNGLRFLLGALFLFPFIRKREEIPGGQWLWTCIAGTILFAAAALQQAGIQYTTAGNAGFITSLSIVIVPFVLWIGWRERPRWLAIVAVVMAGVGTYMLSTGGSFGVRKGDALELVWAQRFTPPTDAALILGLEAVFAVLTAWMFLSETLTLVQIEGCVFILAGVLLTQLRWDKSEYNNVGVVHGS